MGRQLHDRPSRRPERYVSGKVTPLTFHTGRGHVNTGHTQQYLIERLFNACAIALQSKNQRLQPSKTNLTTFFQLSIQHHPGVEYLAFNEQRLNRYFLPPPLLRASPQQDPDHKRTISIFLRAKPSPKLPSSNSPSPILLLHFPFLSHPSPSFLTLSIPIPNLSPHRNLPTPPILILPFQSPNPKPSTTPKRP